MIFNKLKFVADFETTTRDEREDVWLWSVYHIKTRTFFDGTNMEEFVNFVNNINVSADIYFHNLKFDGSFIINYMLQNGCKLNQNDNIKKINKGQFSTLITEMGQFFKITLKNEKGKFINFIDSLKIIPFSAAKIANDFQLGLTKGSIDYAKCRPYDYKPSEDEIAYCRNDVEIIGKAMEIMLNAGYDKLTLSANAFADYQKMTNKTNWRKWFGDWETNCDLELDRDIREAYRGGFCQCNRIYINKTIKQPTYYFDVNSLYPHVMASYDLPYGEPVEYEGNYEYDPDYPLYIQQIQVDLKVKEEGIPCILNKKHMSTNNKYIIDTAVQCDMGNVVNLTLTKFDLDLMFKNYEVYSIRYLKGWKFKARNDMFTNYVKKYYDMKVKTDKTCNRVQRTIAKLFLNSLYGKFGQNPKRAKKYPKLGEDGLIRLKYDPECTDSEPNYRIAKKFHYLPVAVFVTSIARWIIVNDILLIGVKNWIYSDTDSIITLVPLPGNKLSQTKLGKYKTEHIMKRFKCLGQKTYYGIDIHGKKVVAVAGCSKKALQDLPFGKFEYYDAKSTRRAGVISNGRTCLRTCVGGKKVMFSDFCLRDKRDFLEIREEGTYDAINAFVGKDVGYKALTTVLSKHLVNKEIERLKFFNKNVKKDVDFDEVL